MGHVFVVHGDLLKIQTDAMLLPCDRFGVVSPFWEEVLDRPLDPEELRDRVSSERTIDNRVIRFVDTGGVSWDLDPDWLADGVEEGTRALVADVQDRGSFPLVGMPLFGVGAGGYDKNRGEALRAQLTAVADAVADADVDAVVVCYERSDFAALQQQRDAASWPDVAEFSDDIDRLAEAADTGRLVLFFGAGVSVAAGIGTFEQLIAGLEATEGLPVDVTQQLPRRASAVASAMGGGSRLREAILDYVDKPRSSLVHALLAGLRVPEAVTTNFDTLYELAAERPFAQNSLQVLPWHRTDGGGPWLLKAHGDPGESEDFVLTQTSIDDFSINDPLAGGVLRAMFALSREVLFVGYSMRDDNINRIIDEVASAHEKLGAPHRGLGAVLDIESSGVERTPTLTRIGLRTEPGRGRDPAARRLQIFLDRLLWQVSHGESSWLLDERYDALHASEPDRAAAERLRAIALPDGQLWTAVRRTLASWGRRDRA